MLRLEDLLEKIKSYNQEANFDLVKSAYLFASVHHEGQFRKSGEPFLLHPLSVAYLLAEMNLDITSIIAALLHDTVEDTSATLEEVEQKFGEEVRTLVDGVTKLGKIKFRTSEQKQAENFRKMIMAMAQDIRVILIKLADRVHNMRTMGSMPESKQVKISQETIDIYAPIANRLGIQQFKIELEDQALQYLKPDVFKMIDSQISIRKEKLKVYIDNFQQRVAKEMASQNIVCEINGRLKHYYSICRKMESQNITFDEIHDLLAFRIIVDNLTQCYEALGVLHSLWRPIPGRFKDYIAMPKANNYQSLHTTVFAPEGERVELQIRTRQMHEIAEHGVAAHWQYKEGKLTADQKSEMKFRWIRRLLEWQQELDDPAEFLDTVKLDLFADDVYIFTPNGELRELTRGSSPIDFAYSVHTEVGNTCVGARVNGKIVPLSYKLKSGDTVEIITRKGMNPNKDWLKFTRSSKAKAKIRQYLKQEEREQGKKIGYELLDRACQRYSLTVGKLLKEDQVKKFMKEHRYKDVDSLVVALSYGKILPQHLLALVLSKEEIEESLPKRKRPSRVSRKITARSKNLVRVSGAADMLITFGKCCNPIPGDSIVGYVTRGRGVSIHVMDCSKLMSTDPERRIDVDWDCSGPLSRIAKLRVISADKPGVLHGMSEAITSHGVNIVQAHARATQGEKAINNFEVMITDVGQLRQVIKSLESVDGIISVERVRS